MSKCLWFLATLVVACGPDDVVVATLPVDAGSEAGSDAASGCSSNDDCQPAEFCARATCGDAYGSCELRPLVCDDQGTPSCGCDGVSYWNDCLRTQFGATASRAGSCTTGAATCTDERATECPVAGAACARLLPPGPTCDDTALGACWVLPADCPMTGPTDRWSSCTNPMDCRGTCDAIRAGRPFRHDVMRQCGPDFPGPSR